MDKINIQILDKKIEILQPESQTKILLLHIHPNEKTAQETGLKHTIGHKNTTFINFKEENKRDLIIQQNNTNITFDPNRIFTKIGREKELIKRNNDNELNIKTLESFSKKYIEILSKINPEIIIALHNNKNQDYTLKTYYNDPDYKVSKNKNYQESDFILTTDKQIYEKLKNSLNCALEMDGIDDGSLSIYCKQHNIKYINIEAEHGNEKEQKEMLKTTLEKISNTNTYHLEQYKHI